MVELLLNHSPDGAEVPVSTQLRCLVNGVPIHLGGYQVEEGGVTLYPGVLSQATYSRGPKGKETEVQEEMLAYRQSILRLPLGYGAEPSTLQTLQGHPGSWTCTWQTVEGQALRVFHWIVHEDGALSPHSEQFDSLTLAPGAFLVHTEVPKDNPMDARTAPRAVASRAFHGRGFRTPDGKAAARAVPKIGRPSLPKK
jgi:hypothetical protein